MMVNGALRQNLGLDTLPTARKIVGDCRLDGKSSENGDSHIRSALGMEVCTTLVLNSSSVLDAEQRKQVLQQSYWLLRGGYGNMVRVLSSHVAAAAFLHGWLGADYQLIRHADSPNSHIKAAQEAIAWSGLFNKVWRQGARLSRPL